MQVYDEEKTEGGRQGAVAAVIGKKMYYSISEVCAVTGVEAHILRYWEKEFSLLRPKKNSGGKRAYKEKDIEVIVKIKRMLDEEKCTLQGAKAKLLDERRELRAGTGGSIAKPIDTPVKRTKRNIVRNNNGGGGNARSVDSALLLSIRDGLSEVLELLEKPH